MDVFTICVVTDVFFGGTLTATPIPLAFGTGPKLFTPVVLAFPEGAFIGDDPHLLQQDDGDHLLGKHSPCGGEMVHVASKAICCTLSH